ncbi:related to putative N2,N2-dimethylguanosine tRNA methyltransferase [Phialocephala subalpina]|uniref:Protein-lysine N-methyltransferase EFM6 n=1 Tax=Phialocephala subalpina TaxID=576137 RepID=A0A1L7X5T7_9HELO|nr:related to putative N2,N2-dimethylguanosine tRNA methyltransferase [Phialocephala subalpina]
MSSRSPSPEFSPLAIGEDLTPLPQYKAASTTTIDFSNLLETPLKLHEDLTSGCGGQLWPAGMVLGHHMLRYHGESLRNARILELGAGGGLVGLGVALKFKLDHPIYISDQENMIDLMRKNITLNGLESRVKELVLSWGGPLPAEVLKEKPNIILAADCVYFEPAFPLLLATLEELLDLCKEAVIYFCFKKRRKADMHFIKNAKKKFIVEELEDEDRQTFSREALFLYTFKRKQ